jgi:hypothetical protein
MPGFFKRLSELFFGQTVDDPEFGPLTLERSSVLSKESGQTVHSSTRDYWFGRVRFVPIGNEISVTFVVGSREGPSAEQRGTFHLIESRWTDLFGSAVTAAESIVTDWRRDITNLEGVRNALKLMGITLLPPVPTGNTRFFLHFSFEEFGHETGHEITVRYADWQVDRADVT